jgi:actin-related protein
MITVAKERFIAFEGLFKPEMWGKDTPSIPDMVYDAVMACSIDSRKQMCRNIFLSGATTKIPGTFKLINMVRIVFTTQYMQNLQPIILTCSLQDLLIVCRMN